MHIENMNWAILIEILATVKAWAVLIVQPISDDILWERDLYF